MSRAGHGAVSPIDFNSGETGDATRPAKHVDGSVGGNPLPMLLTKIRNDLVPGSVNVEKSVFVAWVGKSDAEGVERRLRMEGI